MQFSELALMEEVSSPGQRQPPTGPREAMLSSRNEGSQLLQPNRTPLHPFLLLGKRYAGELP